MADYMYRLSTHPTTNDAMMDYSVEEEEEDPMSPHSNEETPRLHCPKKRKTGGNNESERWFAVDERGQIKFVENIDEYFSLDSGCSSPDFSDDEPSVSCSGSQGASPVAWTQESSPVQVQHCHRRAGSDTSAMTDLYLDHSLPCADLSLSQAREYNAMPSSGRNHSGIRLKLPPQLDLLPSSAAAPPRLQVRPPPKLCLGPPEEASPSPVYIRDTKIPVNGWVMACRWCGCWTGSSLDIAQEEIPMCGRCKSRWQKVVKGADLSQYTFSTESEDLVISHVSMRLKQHPKLDRKTVCETAMLEVHQTWVAHNGETQGC